MQDWKYRKGLHMCGCCEAMQQQNETDWKKISPYLPADLANPRLFSAEFAELLIMSWLKADKLIQSLWFWTFPDMRHRAPEGRVIFFNLQMIKTLLISHPLNKMHSLNCPNEDVTHCSLLISLEKLISNLDLISRWHYVFIQAADCDSYRDEGLICFPF